MDNKEQKKDNYSKDYKLLVQKLKSIKMNINLLQKNFFKKDT